MNIKIRNIFLSFAKKKNINLKPYDSFNVFENPWKSI